MLPIGSIPVCRPHIYLAKLGLRPLSVRYVCGLLRLQAVLWAVAALGVGVLWITSMAMTWAPVDWTHSRRAWFLVAGICFVVTGGLWAGSAILAPVSRVAARRPAFAAVVLESFMVAFGWLFASHTATGQG
jgi:hypothetical protein